jgi:hypothetical protein
MSHQPIACRLTDAQLRERRSGILAELARAVVEKRELPDGVRLRFEPSEGLLALLAEVIGLERRCCPFLRFQLIVEPEHGPVWLELSGPAGTRELLSGLQA